MAATVPTEPASPVSCYRPMQFKVSRTDPAVSLIVEVFIADASDVSTIGNGLVVGDVVVKYTSTVNGSVPVAVDQTILMDSDCGPYAGVHNITNEFTHSGADYMVIDAVDAGDYTPGGGTGGFRVWLDNYTVHMKVLVYTDPAEDPHEVILKGLPDLDGDTYFNVDLVIRDYFSHEIQQWIEQIPGGSLVQNAHGVTALFYRVHIAETYDVPGETVEPSPFDGTHDILEDDDSDVETYRVAVNAIHPFAGSVTNWEDADMSDYEIDQNVAGTKNWLTDAPRISGGPSITLGEDDFFRGFLLGDSSEDYEVFTFVRVYDMATGSPVLDDQVALTLSEAMAAFSVGIGPADFAAVGVTVPDHYAVCLHSTVAQLSEYIYIKVDRKCREQRRRFAYLNKLGGIDLVTFAGREIQFTKSRRAAVEKPYGIGTGFDFRRRTYRNLPERSRTVSTIPISKETRRWIGEGMSESPNVVSVENDITVPVIVTSGELNTFNSGPLYKPLTIDYELGVDNLSQQA